MAILETGEFIFGECFADDTALVAESHSDLQRLADIVSEFCQSLNIGCNADKTIYVTTDTESPDIEIYDWKTKAKAPCKRKGPEDPIHYLGVYISMNLDWSTAIRNIENTITSLAMNISRSKLSYVQALKAANMVVGGYANFHLQYTDIPFSTLEEWDRKVLTAISKRTGCSENVAHIQHTLPKLCGKHYFRTLTSLYAQIQVSEAMIRLCDTGSTANKIAIAQLQELNSLRCAQTCALADPTNSTVGRRTNPMVIVENCLHLLKFSIHTDSLPPNFLSSRTDDKLILDCIPPHQRHLFAPYLKALNLFYISAFASDDGTKFITNEEIIKRKLCKTSKVPFSLKA